MRIPALRTDRLGLEPLVANHAAEMVAVLADPSLYHFTGGDPPTLSTLEARYREQVRGPADASERWCNWIVRRSADHEPVGFVQATLRGAVADVAWVVGVEHQGEGIATEAAGAMFAWLQTCPVHTVTAHIHPGHDASQHVAAALGLSPSGAVDDEGEEIWLSGQTSVASRP